MAELTAQDIDALMRNQASIERNRTAMEEFRQQDIPPILNQLRDVNSKLFTLTESVGRIVRQVDKPPVIENDTVQADVEEKQTEKSLKPLETISKHLLDIKEFLVKTFSPDPSKPPTGLSQSTKDDSSPTEDLKETSEKIEKQNNEVVSASQSALGWLGALFTIGAIPVIANTLGIGAAGGVSGGILSKVLPKIIPVGKAVMRRIPIIGTLLSWYEGYKKISAGGFDNIVFGLMDVAAGFAYAFPGVGTAIGLGIDVLQYFLTDKANEWKKETGNTSFFGSMWDSIMSYLKDTPIFKWFQDTGRVMKEFWDNPTYDTFMAMAGQFGSILQPIRDTFSMFSADAGAALGLTDSEGNAQGLFGWIGDKVDEWIITPVMDFLEGIFVSIGDAMISMASSVNDFVKRVVDNNIGDGMAKDAIYWAMGWNSGPEPEGGFGEVEELKRPKVKEADGMRSAVKDLAKHVGGKFGEEDYLNFLDAATPEQLMDANTMLRYKARERGLLDSFNKMPEKSDIPKEADLEAEISSPPMSSNVQNNVSNITSTTYVLPESPSMRVGAIA